MPFWQSFITTVPEVDDDDLPLPEHRLYDDSGNLRAAVQHQLTSSAAPSRANSAKKTPVVSPKRRNAVLRAVGMQPPLEPEAVTAGTHHRQRSHSNSRSRSRSHSSGSRHSSREASPHNNNNTTTTGSSGSSGSAGGASPSSSSSTAAHHRSAARSTPTSSAHNTPTRRGRSNSRRGGRGGGGGNHADSNTPQHHTDTATHPINIIGSNVTAPGNGHNSHARARKTSATTPKRNVSQSPGNRQSAQRSRQRRGGQ